MLTEVKSHLKLIARYFLLNLSSAMEYRVSFILQVLGMALNNSAFLVFWWLLFEKVGNVGGYGLKEVLLLWGLASSSYGMAHIVFGNIRNITNIIVNGELDIYLLQPKNVLVNLLVSNTMVSAWGDLTYGYILFFISQGFNIKAFLLFTLFCITGALLHTGLMVVAHSFSFYLGNAGFLAETIKEFIVSFTIYPEGIFKGLTLFILYTIIPAAFITYIPVNIIKTFSTEKILILLAFVLLYTTIAFIIFEKGLKKYESGNLINTRM
ncbi:ABC-2 type transport system permease protein [Caldanaerobius fijiensis DSM 17918]|uniref:ABC-2 type transport system permease protein n=1 Tax=Caldanaerobius fijiensis DSM 17918 TaxID=1121256 RepID=A0A1M4SRC4_9THEO|nr:ABC-2 family transporter protein [Caldanaerobius fijiensis]SHE34813.1 ABC-2 type transport system permease protein [Caldanaerobius fijiensis DSM 17918]